MLKAKKLKGDSVGATRDVPMADYVDVGIFSDRVPGQKLGEPLLVKKVRITQPVTTRLCQDCRSPMPLACDDVSRSHDPVCG